MNDAHHHNSEVRCSLYDPERAHLRIVRTTEPEGEVWRVVLDLDC